MATDAAGRNERLLQGMCDVAARDCLTEESLCTVEISVVTPLLPSARAAASRETAER
jgi:hypothetical protein